MTTTNNAKQLKLNHDFLELQIKWRDRIISTLTVSQILTHSALQTNNDKVLKKLFNDLEETLERSEVTTSAFFDGIILISLISDVEYFFAELLKLILKNYPQKINSVSFTLAEILDLESDEIVTRAADQYINKLMFERPSEYLSKLCKILAIDEDPIKHSWNEFIEAKARRDLGIHNNWLTNETYVRKIKEIGLEPKQVIGAALLPDKDYINNTYRTVYSLISSISQLVSEKYNLNT